jgi:hypothetical protein
MEKRVREGGQYGCSAASDDATVHSTTRAYRYPV